MANILQVGVPTQNAALAWNARPDRNTGVTTLLFINQDLNNTIWLGQDSTAMAAGPNTIPIAPNGTFSGDAQTAWYVIGLVAGIQPLVVVPNGQAYFLGITQGLGNLAIPSIHSPNYNPITGVGWSINKDGSASFNEITIVVQATGVAVLIYFPTAGLGNLIGSWAASEFIDQYGNDIPAGLNANGGVLNAMTVQGASIVASVITNTLLNAVTITNSQITGGTSYEQTITFDTGGGLLIGYSSTTVNVSQTAGGTYQQTLPAGVTTINNAYCWGAGAGGNGGNTILGGNGGGAGEFAGESTYTPSVNPFSYIVGDGGIASTTGNFAGGNGGDSSIDNTGVFANGGNADSTKGTGSTNTIHHDGGIGGPLSIFPGAASGGNSGNPISTGNNGTASTGSPGAPAPGAQSNSGTGGAGGADGSNGSNGGSPGAGGGGAGRGTNSTGSLSKTYTPVWMGSYYGPDGSTPNARRSTSTMYQGGETAGGGSFNGNMRSAIAFNRAQIASDFAGYTVTGCTVQLTNQHSWYNSGMSIEFDVSTNCGGSSSPGSWPDSMTKVATSTIGEGATKTFSLGASVGAGFASGSTNGLGIGANVYANAPYNLNWYGYFSAGTSIKLVITGTKTVSGSNTSGTGADGKVSFSYTSAQAMVFGLSAVAGSDSVGNAFAAGYTGPTVAIHPGSNPAVVETWQPLTVDSGWAGVHTTQYRMLSDGNLQLSGEASISFANASARNLNSSNPLPTAYRPANTHDYREGDLVGSRCHLSLNAAGVIAVFPPSGATFPNTYFAEIDGIVPLT